MKILISKRELIKPSKLVIPGVYIDQAKGTGSIYILG